MFKTLNFRAKIEINKLEQKFKLKNEKKQLNMRLLKIFNHCEQKIFNFTSFLYEFLVDQKQSKVDINKLKVDQ